jgi:hypothetical protein
MLPTVNTTITVTTAPPTPVQNREITGSGTVCKVGIDNAFFGIVSDNGEHYLPGKIDPLFQVDGLRVTYRALERHDRNDPGNWGTPVDLQELVQVGMVIDQRINANGTIDHEEIENGFYGIIADNGQRYQPLVLNDTYKKEGLRVNFSAYPATVSTIAMWGTPVRLVTIGLAGEPEEPLIVMSGHIRWIGYFDGDLYGIMGDDGKLYLPSEIDPAFKKRGLYVNFTAEKADGNSSISKVRGIPVKLLDIEVNKKG